MSTTSQTVPLLSPRNVICLSLWTAALLGMLQLHRWPRLFGQELFGCGICGPWGCGPPVSALVSYHGFWCLLIFPTVAILKARLRPSMMWNWGLGLSLASAVGIVSLLMIYGLDNSAAEKYPLRWSLFQIVTFVDLPLVQIGLAGFWMHWASRKSLKNSPQDVGPHESL